ncbi:placenta-specific gene 8 protein [Moschus berezovskii]|uniref:placenta-specific gene 8 protein n=1 Tax=Moschus berezovskii TaxID=68408 RepID=UPI0024444426|nr:placenta-specific gene 8 protein [Moschus berezovskii]
MQASPSPVVIVTQPGVGGGLAPQNSNWQTGMCDCFSDCGGSICDDYMVTLCCPLCSLCQIKRDINRRRASHTF